MSFAARLNRPATFAVSCNSRCFSTTAKSNSVLDYFKFFKKNPAAKTAPVKDTDQVIKDVEQNQENITEIEKITILGTKNPRYTDAKIIEKNLNGFKVNTWIQKPNQNSFVKNLNTENFENEISVKLSEIFQNLNIDKQSKLDNLYLRFAIFKTVQSQMSIEIPDYQLSKFVSFDYILNYLQSKTILNPQIKNSEKSEFKPDAVDFNLDEFNGTNVSIGKWTFENEKRRNYKKLLRKANILEKNSVKDFEKAEAGQATV